MPTTTSVPSSPPSAPAFSSGVKADCTLSGSTAKISCPGSDAKTVFDAQIAFFHSPYYHEKQTAYVVDLPKSAPVRRIN